MGQLSGHGKRPWPWMKSGLNMNLVRRHTTQFVWWLLVFHTVSSVVHVSGANTFLPPATNLTCVCPGDILTYTCTTMGAGITEWEGSAFDCADTNNQITLRHSQFPTDGGTFGNCNGGNIQAQSIGVSEDNSKFTSQLNVTLNGDYPTNATVTCSHISNERETHVGSSTFNLVTAPYPSPGDITLTNVFRDYITFNWTSVAPDCSSVQYTIESMNCGDCPSSTSGTKVTCNGTVVPSLCTFSIQSVICNLFGNQSRPIVVHLKVPDIPGIEAVVPHYFNDTQSLIRLTLNVNQTLIATVHRKLRTTNYTIYYENSSLLNSNNIDTNHSCTADDCEYTVTSPILSYCNPKDSIYITVSAINLLGESPMSERFHIGCKPDSNFVRVEYIKENDTFCCTFLNTLDTSQKSCSIRYGQCGEVLSQRMEKENTTGDSAAVIRFKIDTSSVEQILCYNITASNSTYTITVEGQINVGSMKDQISHTAIIIAIVVPICALLLILTLIVLGIIVLFRITKLGDRKQMNSKLNEKQKNESDPDQHDEILLTKTKT